LGTHFNIYSHPYANTDAHGYTRRKSYSDAAASSNTATSSRLYNVICSLTGTRCYLHADSSSIDAISFSSAQTMKRCFNRSRDVRGSRSA
jgi:hypothetical protein